MSVQVLALLVFTVFRAGAQVPLMREGAARLVTLLEIMTPLKLQRPFFRMQLSALVDFTRHIVLAETRVREVLQSPTVLRTVKLAVRFSAIFPIPAGFFLTFILQARAWFVVLDSEASKLGNNTLEGAVVLLGRVPELLEVFRVFVGAVRVERTWCLDLLFALAWHFQAIMFNSKKLKKKFDRFFIILIKSVNFSSRVRFPACG